MIMIEGPTYVGTLKLSEGSYCVAIINIAAHIELDEITIMQAKNHGLLIDKVDYDVRISPINTIWDEQKALSKRDVIEYCLLSNGFHKLFESCDMVQ